MKTYFYPLIVLFLFARVSSEAQSITRGPYLQFGTPSSMVIKWRTDSPTSSQVWYGSSPSNLVFTQVANGSFTDHEVTISGLPANSTFYYAVGNTSGQLMTPGSDHYFKTSPPSGSSEPVSIWVLGDAGQDTDEQRSVRDAFYTHNGSTHADVILALGDNAYSDGTDLEYQYAWFENMFEASLVNSVLWSCVGNHDVIVASSATETGPYYDIFSFPRNGEAGGLPSGTEAWYSFDYANVHFISLNSEDVDLSEEGPMLTWLGNDLAATDQDWIVAFFHQPPYYSSGDVRRNFLPILEAGGVDLVLYGHKHNYQRSSLMKENYGAEGTFDPATMIVQSGDGRQDGDGPYQKSGDRAPYDGTIYMLTGSAGKVSNIADPYPFQPYREVVLGSVRINVTGQQMDLEFIGAQGGVLDYFTILKGQATQPTVSITSPMDGASYPSIPTLTITADASDPDGQVSQVDFLANGAPIGTTLSAPFFLDWAVPADGDYNLQARVTDNDGNTALSAIVSISVGVSMVCPGIGDDDGDGVCNDVDCDDSDPNITTQPGDPCEDGDPNTSGETIQPDCSCSGGILTPTSTCSFIDNNSDDAEERSNGKVNLNSNDLQLVTDPRQGVQVVGMKFNNLNIPQGANITNAYIQFTVDETSDEDPCHLTIYGEASDNASTFVNNNYDISSRPRTTASVSWSPPNWLATGDAGLAQQTPDLSSIIQEIVNRSGYSSTSSFSIIIEGTGRRTAESASTLSQAPQLCVDYFQALPPYDCPGLSAYFGDSCDDNDNTTLDDMVGLNCTCAGTATACTGTGDADGDGVCTDVDCDDNDPNIGSNADDADCDGVPTAEDCDDSNASVGSNVDDMDCDGVPSSLDCDDQDASIISTNVNDADCDGVPSNLDCNDNDPNVISINTGDADCDGVPTTEDCDDQDPSITNTNTDDADCDGIPTSLDCNDNDPNVTSINTSDADCDGVPTTEDCDDNNPNIAYQPGDNCNDGNPGTSGETIQADCSCGGGTITITSTCSSIDNNSDDAEERSNGKINLNGNDLQLVTDPRQGIQTIGLRFNNLNIPQGANITNAYIQFTVDEATNEDPCNLTIYGVASDNATTFVNSNYDVSGRPRTTISETWAPAQWLTVGDAGPAQQTPDLSAILQEIVNRSGFSTGSSIAIIIEGTGQRAAKSASSPAEAPQLCVDYLITPPPYDCPGLSAYIGDACDDGDNATIDDTVDTDCQCVGVPTACTGIGDDDGDGVCSNVDCDDNDATIISQIGDACDDNDPNTVGETIQGDCSCGGGTPAPTQTCSRVSVSSDDAEEQGGLADLTSSDIELATDPNLGSQTVGMRFNGLNIPQGAVITSAYIQFGVDEAVNDNPCNINIYGQSADNGATFSGTDFDISGRPRTNAVVNWAPQEWLSVGNAGPAQQTPDLSAIIQEIVNRSGFTTNSSVVIIMDGEGRRTAESADGGSPQLAPELCVEYLSAATSNQSMAPGDTQKTAREQASTEFDNIGSISVHPNPANNRLHISFSSKLESTVQILARDINGKIVLRKLQQITKGKNRIVLEGLSLPDGLYFLQLFADGNVQSAKLVISKD